MAQYDSDIAPSTRNVVAGATYFDELLLPEDKDLTRSTSDRTSEQQAEIDDASSRYEKLVNAQAAIAEDFSAHLWSIEHDSDSDEIEDSPANLPISSPNLEFVPPLNLNPVPLAADSTFSRGSESREFVASVDSAPRTISRNENEAAQSTVSPQNTTDSGKKKKKPFREFRKQAAAITGIHRVGKSVHKSARATAEKARAAFEARNAASAGAAHRSSGGEDEDLSMYEDGGMGASGEGPERVAAVALGLARKGRLQVLVNWLRRHGNLAPDEIRRADGWTIAHAAAEGGRADVLIWAVHYSEPREGPRGIVGGGGLFPNVATKNGLTPAHVAAANGFVKLVPILSELGANLETADSTGARPIHSAASSNHSRVVRELAAHGCDLNAITVDGATAAYVAAGNGCDDVIRVLGELGADMSMPSNDGWTPAQIAHELGYTKVLHALSDLVVASLGSPRSADSDRSDGGHHSGFPATHSSSFETGPPPLTDVLTPSSPVEREQWVCAACTFLNAAGSAMCDVCGTPQQAIHSILEAKGPVLPVETDVAHLPAVPAKDNIWTCSVCTFQNAHSCSLCRMCGGAPSFKSFGSTSRSDGTSTTKAQSSGASRQSVGVWREVESDEYPGHTYFLNDATGEATWERH